MLLGFATDRCPPGPVRILSGHRPDAPPANEDDTALTSTDTRPDTSGQTRDTL